VRQVLDQELQKTLAQRESAARLARLSAGASTVTHHTGHSDYDENDEGDKENRGRDSKFGDKANRNATVKRDFFGRVIVERPALAEADGNVLGRKKTGKGEGEGARVWVTYHEGINNAVRKPVSLEEFMRGF
jgi:chromosome transmission fidelity protein 18